MEKLNFSLWATPKKKQTMIIYIKQEHKQNYINQELNDGYKIRTGGNYFISYLGKNTKKNKFRKNT